MKPILAALVLTVLISNQLAGQNWAPINSAEKFHYTDGVGALISNTLFVDSVLISGNDSLFYLNLILSACNTCDITSFGLSPNLCNSSECVLEKNQSQFMGSTIQVSDNAWSFILDSDTIIIKPQEGLGETWTYDNQSIAEVVELDFVEVFTGVFDSTKTILCTNGDEYLLSKQHGFISWSRDADDFELSGIQERNLGALMPSFESVFDFEVGDVLEYRFLVGDESAPGSSRGEFKRSITAVENYTDSVKIWFELAIHTQTTTLTFPGSNIEDDYLLIEDSMIIYSCSSIFDHHVNQRVDIWNTQCTYNSSQGLNEFQDPYSCLVSIDSLDSRLILSLGVNLDFYSPQIDSFMAAGNNISIQNLYGEYEFLAQEFWILDDMNQDFGNSPASFQGIAFGDGIGRTSFHWGNDFNMYSEKLVGFVKNGDTTGVITPNNILLSLSVNEGRELALFPNPARDYISIKTPQEITYELHFLDQLGRSVLVKSGAGDSGLNRVDISGLSNGVYLVHLMADNKIWSNKLIKQ